MNYKSVLTKECPNCHSQIRNAQVKGAFICPSCGIGLVSNSSTLWIFIAAIGAFGFVVFLLLAAQIMKVFGIPENSYVTFKAIVGLLYAGTILLIRSVFLKVRKADDERLNRVDLRLR